MAKAQASSILFLACIAAFFICTEKLILVSRILMSETKPKVTISFPKSGSFTFFKASKTTSALIFILQKYIDI